MPAQSRLVALATGLGALSPDPVVSTMCSPASDAVRRDDSNDGTPTVSATAVVATTSADPRATVTIERRRALPADRSDFLLEEGLCYLNTGTLGPLPRAVVSAVTEELEYVAANPLNNYFGGGNDARLFAGRGGA